MAEQLSHVRERKQPRRLGRRIAAVGAAVGLATAGLVHHSAAEASAQSGPQSYTIPKASQTGGNYSTIPGWMMDLWYVAVADQAGIYPHGQNVANVQAHPSPDRQCKQIPGKQFMLTPGDTVDINLNVDAAANPGVLNDERYQHAETGFYPPFGVLITRTPMVGANSRQGHHAVAVFAESEPGVELKVFIDNAGAFGLGFTAVQGFYCLK